MSDPGQVVNEILELFRRRGGSEYGGENVTQLEHALQCAALAQAEQAEDTLVAAALLHDVGHLLHDLDDDAPDRGVDDLHENLGAAWLKNRAPAAVSEPVRLHVDAKRYLCASEPAYYDTLSEPSRVSLRLQGGPMTAEQRAEFERNPFWRDGLRLRRWDDEAKVVDAVTPSLEDLRESLVRALGERA
ncbi:MAG: HD domain-containing protein [Acidobacteria bacterium]|nr:HD domain-containing protein [Acidobacteriota bacterium]